MRKHSFYIILSALIIVGITIILWDLFSGPPPQEKTDQTVPFSPLIIVVIFLSISTAISAGISYYLYRWRKILLSKPELLVPEEWAKYLQHVGKGLEKVADSVNRNMNDIKNAAHDNSKRITNMTETYMVLQEALDEKDQQIKRYKNGYDAEIFKKFINRFARVDQAVDDFLLDDKENKELIGLKRLMGDAFEECGVERFSPEIGEDYRRASGVSDNPKVIKTPNKELDFKIAEIVEHGYSLNAGQEAITIIPSKVRVYKYEESKS